MCSDLLTHSHLSSHQRVLLAFVTYGLLHSNGAPVSVTEFSSFDAQCELKRIPAGQTIAGDPLGMLALDGYVEALKVFTFRAVPIYIRRSLNMAY